MSSIRRSYRHEKCKGYSFCVRGGGGELGDYDSDTRRIDKPQGQTAMFAYMRVKNFRTAIATACCRPSQLNRERADGPSILSSMPGQLATPGLEPSSLKL